MKKWILIFVILLAFDQPHRIHDLVYPPQDLSANHHQQVILYATEWCGYCKKIKQVMDAHRISYYEYDIEKSVEGKKQYQSLNGNGVPLLVINNEIVRGYDVDRMLELVVR